MYRFTRRPRWLLSHLLALVAVVVFVVLGLWQLRRHDERAARNDAVAARTELAPAPIAALLPEPGDQLDPAHLEGVRYRPVVVDGTYRDETILVDNRSRDGLPGAWVLGALARDDGPVVVVVRGFQPADTGVVDPVPPPQGRVQVTGTVAGWDERTCGTRTDDAGALAGMACLRRDAVEDALGTPVAPIVVQRRASEPAEASVLSAVPLPESGPGPHRGYAGQWFIFAALVAITYPLILRKVARDRATASGPP